jgi:hypothetical protein
MSEITTIETINNQATVDRTGESLGSIWASSQSPAKGTSKQGPFLFTGDGSDIPSSVSELIESSKERLLISTQSFSDTSIIQATESALERGVRVYMIVDTTGFESILKNPSCNALHGNALLRERQGRGLDIVISDWHLANRTGILLSTPLDGTLTSTTSGWAMNLSKSQIDEFSAHIQHEFWSITEGREVLSPEEARNPRPIAEAPFTLRAIQNQDHILRAILASDGDDSKAEATLRKEKKWAGQIIGESTQSSIILQGEAIEVGTDATTVLYSSPMNVEPSSGRFAHSGLSVQLAIGSECYLGGWDRSANDGWHSILRLNAEQAKAAKSLLDSHSKSPEWVGHSKINIGDAGNRIIRNGKEMDIEKGQTVELGVVYLDEMPDSVDTLETHEPAMQVPTEELALQCNFSWTSAPPVVPKSANEDALHSEWMDARKAVAKRLTYLKEVNKPSKIPGFGRKQKEIQKSIDEALSQVGVISDSKGFAELIASVESLSESVGANLDGLKAAEDEASRAALEKEQKEAHQIAVEKAKSEIKDLTTRLKTSNKELKSLETSLKSAEGVEEKRIKSDLSQLRPKIKQMESNLSQAKETSTSKFQFKAPVVPTSSKKGESKGHKFLGDTRNTSLGIDTPAEDLPDAGTLYSEDDNRYLAITNWEEVVQGRKDAKRLNATLCAVREVLG